VIFFILIYFQLKPKIDVEDALQVLAVMEAARKSSATGTKVKMQSTFKYPIL
jgi:hypothetical protein